MTNEVEIEQVKSDALAIPEQAKAILVVDNASYAQAGSILVEIKGLRKKIKSVFSPMKEAAVKAHKAILEQERQADKPLIEAENIIKPALAKFDADQETIRYKKELALRAVAKKAEEERQLAEAIALEAQGEKKEAAQVMSEPVYVPPVVVASTVPKLKGVSYPVTWKFRVVNVGAIPKQYLMPDMVKIGGVVRAMKSGTNIPGIEAYPEKGTSSRAR